MEATKANILYVKGLCGRRVHVKCSDGYDAVVTLNFTRSTEGFTDDKYKLWELGVSHPIGGTEWIRLDAVEYISETSTPPLPEWARKGVNSEDSRV